MQHSLFGSALMTETTEQGATTPDLLQSSLADAVFTVIDLETTGLNPQKNAITEITAIQFKNGEEVGKYSTLVKPTEPIPAEAEAITGISNDMVAGAPAPVMALSDLCAFVGSNPIIVGHNVMFDIRFLLEKLNQNGLGGFQSRFLASQALCTKVLAQRAIPGLHSYEGVVVANHCGIVNDNPHRAEYDVRMSAGILFSIMERLKGEGQDIATVEQLLDFQGRLG